MIVFSCFELRCEWVSRFVNEMHCPFKSISFWAKRSLSCGSSRHEILILLRFDDIFWIEADYCSVKHIFQCGIMKIYLWIIVILSAY